MIDTASLKQTIINQATSGLLSWPSPDDTPVDGLIAALPEPSAKRKKWLSKSINMDRVGDIPEHWRWVTLGEISSYGDTPRKVLPSEITDNTWILELEDIESGGSLIKKKYGFDRKPKGEKTAFSKGQILYSKLRPYLKKVLIADEDGISTPELISFDVFAGIDPAYITYCLTNSYVDRIIEKRSYGIKMPRVDAAFMVNIPIPLPPTEEQHRIVKVASQAFAEIERLENTQKKITEDFLILKNKIIDAGIRGELTEQLPVDGNAEELYQQIQTEKDEILKERKGRADKKIKEVSDDVPFDIPNNWKWIRFGEIGLFKKGPFGSALTKAMFVPKGSDTVKVYEQQHAIKKDPYLGTYYIPRQYFDDKMNSFEVLPGDVIVSCAGTIGETYILPEGIEQGIINQALMRITLARSIDKRFFQYYFDSNLKASAQSESNGMAITNIPPFEVLKNWYFPLPPLAEQKRIVEKIEELLAAIPE